MDTRRCPSCGAATVLDGRITLRGEAGSVGFEPVGTISPIWKAGLDLPVCFYCCSSCGIVWTRLEPETLRAYVHDRGGNLAWDHLQALEFGRLMICPTVPKPAGPARGSRKSTPWCCMVASRRRPAGIANSWR